MDKNNGQISNLLKRLKAGSKATKEIPWPGSDNEEDLIRMRVLNDEDYLKATLAADKMIPNVTMANVSRYNAELETQLLYRSLTDPETGHTLGTITEFRQLLSPEIKAILVDELDALHNENSPNVESMTDEDFDKLFEEVKKNAEKTVSSISSIHILRKLVKSLASTPKK